MSAQASFMVGGQPVAGYQAICCDPPWSFGDRLGARGAESNYPVMTIADLITMPLPPLAEHCRLFMWRVSSQVEEAYRVVRAWGFTPKTEIVWQKTTSTGLHHFGMGRTVRASHETCIVAVRGNPPCLSRSIRSTFAAPVGRHSEKPECFYRDIVEKLSPGPYVELFARGKVRDGWAGWGNEATGNVIQIPGVEPRRIPDLGTAPQGQSSLPNEDGVDCTAAIPCSENDGKGSRRPDRNATPTRQLETPSRIPCGGAASVEGGSRDQAGRAAATREGSI